MDRRCPDDGYPMQTPDGFFGTPEPRCTNPWHPTRVGPCPKCGSTAPPGQGKRAAFFGVPLLAVCADCGREWSPRAARA